MKQPKPNGTKPVLTTKEHRFSIGQVPMIIPAGVPIDDAMNDAELFVTEAKDLLMSAALGKSADDEIPQPLIWAAIHLLMFAEQIHSAAHTAMLQSRVLLTTEEEQ